MKAMIVVSLDIKEPEDVTEAVRHMDPPSIPHFANEVRVVVGDHADELVTWLDEEG